MIKIIGYIIRKIMKIYWNQFELNIPIFEIQNKHLVNAKMLPNREQLLENLPKNGIVAELGVDNGRFSEKILEINKPKILHLIDSWDSARYSKNKEKKVFDMFKHQVKLKHTRRCNMCLERTQRFVTCLRCDNRYCEDWFHKLTKLVCPYPI